MMIRRLVPILLAGVLSIAVPSVVNAAPAQPALPGYDAQWCGQSAYPTLHVGDMAQLSTCFTNTGSIAWVNGTATEVALAVCIDTPAPPYFACNVLSPYADWASNWTSARLYATPSSAVIAPGSLSQLIYNLKVPAGTAPGDYYLRGELVQRTTMIPIHPVGYYVVVHVIP